MTNWSYRIDRDRLIKGLVGSQKMGASFSGTFHYAQLPSHKGLWAIPGYHTLIVKPSLGRTRKHRTFILCKCGREIPTGRFHQHKGACK